MFKKYILFFLALITIFNAYGINNQIFSSGSSSKETLAQFLSNGNSSLGEELVNEFATIYIEESKLEGINWDIAFVQMCLETGFLRYGGLVEIGQNNFCGLGSFDNKQGASFSTIRDGVKAHVQHLKAYGSTEELVGELLDPRFHLVKRGSATNVEELAGKWAEDPKYGNKLISLLKRVDFLEKRDIVLRAEISIGFESVSIPSEMVVIEDINSDETIIKEVFIEEISAKDIKTDINIFSESEKIEMIQEDNGWLR